MYKLLKVDVKRVVDNEACCHFSRVFGRCYKLPHIAQDHTYIDKSLIAISYGVSYIVVEIVLEVLDNLNHCLIRLPIFNSYKEVWVPVSAFYVPHSTQNEVCFIEEEVNCA